MVESRSRREFDEILSEKNVVKELNELDRLIAEAKGRQEKGDAPFDQPYETLALSMR